MQQYTTRRVLQLIPVLVLVSLMVFFLIRLAPGDPVTMMLGEEFTPEAKEAVTKQWGLDRPLALQYFSWVQNVMSGNLGESYRAERSVSELIAERLPVTFTLSMLALAIGVLVGVPLGTVAAVRHRSVLDYGATTLGVLLLSVPNFWLAMIMVVVFSVHLGWLPSLGWVDPWEDPIGGLRRMAMPAIALSAAPMAVITRMTRTSMLEVLREDYVRTARAKGLRERTVIFRHALRNAWLPTITVIGLGMGFSLGGSVIIEELFGIPGMGKLMVFSIFQREYPIVQGVVLVFGLWIAVMNLLVDLSYAFFDPRITYS